MQLDGRMAIAGCPCEDEKIVRFERFIWRHAGEIAEYLRLRSTDDLRAAQFMADTVAAIPEPLGMANVPEATILRRRIRSADVTITVPRVPPQRKTKEATK